MNDSSIISIDPVDPVFSITWRLGRRCNYDCMYCPEEFHDNNSKHHSLDTLQKSWLQIFEKTKHKNLKYKISFTGGEVTSSRAFLPFLRWLNDNYAQYLDKVLVTTNGSATTKYYQRLYQYVDNMSFSVHSEHIDENKFFTMIVDLAKYIDSKKFIHVNIMDEFWNKDRIELYTAFLQKHQISYNVNKINYGMQTRTIPIFKGNLNFDLQ